MPINRYGKTKLLLQKASSQQLALGGCSKIADFIISNLRVKNACQWLMKLLIQYLQTSSEGRRAAVFMCLGHESGKCWITIAIELLKPEDHCRYSAMLSTAVAEFLQGRND
jgi:hypothetical protein